MASDEQTAALDSLRRSIDEVRAALRVGPDDEPPLEVVVLESVYRSMGGRP